AGRRRVTPRVATAGYEIVVHSRAIPGGACRARGRGSLRSRPCPRRISRRRSSRSRSISGSRSTSTPPPPVPAPPPPPPPTRQAAAVAAVPAAVDRDDRGVRGGGVAAVGVELERGDPEEERGDAEPVAGVRPVGVLPGQERQAEAVCRPGQDRRRRRRGGQGP